MRAFLSILILVFISQFNFAQEVVSPNQPEFGPGSSEYAHDSLIIHNFAENPDGYWLYEPACPTPNRANVVVFLHGHSAYNPMIYGAWIKHLVLKGNIVIFPRYQKSMFSPSPDKFVENTAKGIRDALKELQTGDHVTPAIDVISLVGHSYGGVISANLAVNYKELEIPYPHAVMLCSPGSGPFRGGVLDDYSEMPAETKLLVVVSEDDKIVGDKMGKRVYETAQNVKNRNLLRQYEDDHGDKEISAGHNESYALDAYFDSGVRNVSTKRAQKFGTVDAMDYYGYWKLFDALLDCARADNNCKTAFGNTPEQRSLGKWSDGTIIKEFEVSIPEKDNEEITIKTVKSTQ
jgi:pimeloyl-ACP methyl ester carboxylesterase